jgi:hypothetical protein
VDAGNLPIQHTDPDQDQDTLARVVDGVQSILTPNEEILYIALQNKMSLSLKKDSVVATNNRFIIYRPDILGRVRFSDYLWEDVKDVKIHEGMLTADVNVELVDGRQEALGGLDKTQVRRLYAICQQKEQEWREKRRIRDMEEARARSGGVHLGAGFTPPNQASDDPVEKLAKAKAMLDQGLITEAEYEGLKAKIIASF